MKRLVLIALLLTAWVLPANAGDIVAWVDLVKREGLFFKKNSQISPSKDHWRPQPKAFSKTANQSVSLFFIGKTEIFGQKPITKTVNYTGPGSLTQMKAN